MIDWIKLFWVEGLILFGTIFFIKIMLKKEEDSQEE